MYLAPENVRKNHPSGPCDEDYADLQASPPFCRPPVPDLHPQPGLQGARPPAPPDRRVSAHCENNKEVNHNARYYIVFFRFPP